VSFGLSLKERTYVNIWAKKGDRRIHNEELHDLYSTPHIAIVIKPMSMRWAEYVACMGEMINKYTTVARKL
jgi:hypothetical protein